MKTEVDGNRYPQANFVSLSGTAAILRSFSSMALALAVFLAASGFASSDEAAAQTKVKLIAKPVVVAKPGSSINIPVKISSSSAIAPTSHVIIDGTPDWLTLSAGESVGDGVWLLRVSQLAKLKMSLAAAAKGERKMGVLLVDKDGKIVGETEFILRTEGKVAKRSGPTTWQSLVGGGGAAGAAPGSPPAGKKVAVAKIAKQPPAGATPKKTFKKLSRKAAKAYARHLVRECTTCHSLYGNDDGIPVMVGLKPDRFVDTMDLYRRGKRDNLVMINVSRSLDDQQIEVLANYLSGISASASVGRARTAKARTASRPVAASATAKSGSQKTRITKRKITQAKLKRAGRWVVRGQDLLTSGRVAQARLWFRRAADYGIAEAAMLLGTSFDPNYLRAGAGLGLKASPRKARDWYVYARQLGSQAAGQRLSQLPAG